MLLKRIATGSAAAAVVALALTQSSADAHHPEIQVTCAESPSTIRITAVAWDTSEPGHRENTSVVVTVNGTPVHTGAFNPGNGHAFTIQVTVPAGASSAVVRATSTVAWGPQQQFGSAGEYREATIPLPCSLSQVTSTTVAPTTTAPTTTAPTTTAPTATTAPPATTIVTPEPAVTTTAPTTTVVEVLGAVEIPRAVVAQPVVASPRFTG
jgi:hypothetical protein